MAQFKTVKDKQDAVDAYFAAHERPTLSGLARVFGMSRLALANYGGSDRIVADARWRVEEYLESRLGGPGERGAMFSLKSQFGWSEGRAPAVVAAPVVAKAQAPVRRARDMTDEELMAIIDGRA